MCSHKWYTTGSFLPYLHRDVLMLLLCAEASGGRGLGPANGRTAKALSAGPPHADLMVCSPVEVRLEKEVGKMVPAMTDDAPQLLRCWHPFAHYPQIDA